MAKSRSRRRSVKKSRSRIRIGSLKKGLLTRYGYHAHDSATKRHTALRKAAKAYGSGNLVLKLNAVCVLNRYRSPSTAAKFCADKRWVQKNLYKNKSKSRSRGRKASRKPSRSRHRGRKSLTRAVRRSRCRSKGKVYHSKTRKCLAHKKRGRKPSHSRRRR